MVASSASEPVRELVSRLSAFGVTLWLEGEKLRYRAPTGLLTPATLALLRERKAELIAFLEEGQIGRTERSGASPLSFAQGRLWFLDRLAPGSAGYSMPGGLRLRGVLDIRALEASLREVVRRHETLRTTFEDDGGQAVQRVHPSLDVPLPVVDLRAIPAGDRDARVRALAATEAAEPFDLARGPLIRARLLRLADDDHVLLFNMHHIVSDGWSMGVLVREVTALYAAFAQGRPSPLDELPIQYADYAAWQRRFLDSDSMKGQQEYWIRHLRGASNLDLPIDHPRPALQSHRGNAHTIELGPQLTAALHETCRKQGSTLFMALLTAFSALLARYAGTTDVIVGTPIAGRKHQSLEGLIGLFVNTLPIRVDLSGDPTFEELLDRVRGTALDAYANQDVPFDRIVHGLNLPRDLGRTPLIQVMLSVHNAPTEPVSFSGVLVAPIDVERDSAQFDLALDVVDTAGGLVCSFEYSTALFEPVTVRRFADLFRQTVRSLAFHPTERARSARLQGDADGRALPGAVDAPPSAPSVCVHQLFEAAALADPQAIAIRSGDENLTYGELNARANRLARRLRTHGVGPDVVVGICMARSPEMILALLAILKAGGAYLPLDPTYPRERLAHMVRDARLELVLTRRASDLPAGGLGRDDIRILDDIAAIAGDESLESTDLLATSDPLNLAYVIYTSGSTGAPKGVMIAHRSLVNYVWAIIHHYELRPSDRVLQFASLSFDVSAEEIFPALAAGAALTLRTDEMLGDTQSLWDEIRRHDLTVVNLPTALWHRVVADVDPVTFASASSLRLVVIGGEQADRECLERWCTLAGSRPRLLNVYGPTEATIGSTIGELSRAEESHRAVVAIGGPIAGVSVHLCDEQGRSLPWGMPGRLHIGGAGVGRGYLGNPALTAEKFVPDPDGVGTRLYDTGDLARARPDGSLEYMGRVDSQIKLRGFRIELGEIEAVIRQQPGVLDVVVIVTQGHPGEKRLVAYVVVAAADAFSELRARIRERLPDYMVPSTLVRVEEIPLGPSGKVDRRALPAPQGEDGAVLYVGPRTAAEVTLAAVWADVLKLPRVGIHDNFFELGGDSILLMRLIGQMARSGLRVTAQQAFQNPTIARLATVASSLERAQVSHGAVIGSVELTPIQRWFFETEAREPHHYNQAVMLQAKGTWDPSQLEEAWRAVLVHHDALRHRFVRTGAAWNQVAGGADKSTPFARVDLSRESESEQKTLVETKASEAQVSFDLAEGPIARMVLFDLGQSQGVRILIVIHHLVVDGVSWRILLEDLAQAYTSLARAEPIRLPEKTTSFQTWATHLKAHATSDAQKQELLHWLDLPETAALPVDRPQRPEVTTRASSRTLSVSLSEPMTRALLQQVPAAYGTQINDVLLTALLQAFAAWTGSPRLRIDLEGHGREEHVAGDLDLSRTVGWFTSVFPVVLELDPRGAGDALKRVKETLRQVPHRGIGYGVLRYLSDDAETTSALEAQPNAEVLFNYLGQIDHGLTEVFSPATEASGRSEGQHSMRTHLFDVNACVLGGQLRVEWSYGMDTHERSTVEALANAFIDSLESLIRHCGSSVGGYTPSDFPLIDLGQEALDRLLLGAGAAGRGGIEDVYPLTRLQKEMLSHHVASPRNDPYVLQLSIDFGEELNAEAVERTLRELVKVHPVLRTSIHWTHGEPLQIVHCHADVHLERTSVSDEHFEAWLEENRRRGFDLDKHPLTRMAIMPRPGGWRLVWTTHHIITDGWSHPLMFRDLAEGYAQARGGKPLSIASPPPFRAFVEWLAHRDERASLDFWRRALDGVGEAAALGGQQTVHAIPQWVTRDLTLDAGLTAQVGAFCRAQHVTVATFFHALWAIVLARLSGRNNVVFGSMASGRSAPLPDIDAMVGPLINVLPVRVRLPSLPFSRWISELQGQLDEARQHEHASFAQVEVGIAAGRLVIDSLLTFENYPAGDVAALASVMPVRALRSVEYSHYPVWLLIMPGDALVLNLQYDGTRFPASGSAIPRALQHLEQAMRSVLANPAQAADAVDVLRDTVALTSSRPGTVGG